MKIELAVGVFVFLFASGAANSKVEFGTSSSDFGSVEVQEDIANPDIPKHFVYPTPQDGSNSAGVLILRCQNKSTEVFYAAKQGEFFGFGTAPDIAERFKSEQKSHKIRASGSSDGSAAFISSPIDFISKLIKEGLVILSGSYYSGSFAAKFDIDDVVADGIYSMAETCEWSKKLPARADAAVVKAETSDQPTNDESTDKGASTGVTAADRELGVALQSMVAKYGMDAVQKALSQITTPAK